MNKSDTYLLINQFEVSSSDLNSVISTWKNTYSDSTNNRCLYTDEDNMSLLEIVTLENVSNLEKEIGSKEQFVFEESIRQSLTSDWRRQLLKLKDVVIPTAF